MRRNYRGRFTEDIDTKKMLYIVGTILALAVIAFVITFFVYGNTLNKTNELSRINTNSLGTITAIEETSTSYGKTVDEVKNDMKDSNKVAVNTSIMEGEKTETKKEENKSTTKNNEKKSETKQVTIKDPEFKMPVSGEIMKEFADNKLVYSSTLDVWTTHNGIDIAADKTTVVKASADGTVKSIKNDPRYGITIIIEHVNGYKTVYSNLLSTEFVVEGEKVKQGQSIGTVGNSAAFEVSDEPHLHFEIRINGEAVDPLPYLAGEK